MRFHKINMIGRFLAQVVDITALSYSSDNEGAVYYDTNTDQLFYGDNDKSDFRSLVDIEVGSIILTESNTSLLGYNLLTNIDDHLVYITKGSVSGGETGGTNKIGGTWTQPNHTHNLNSHTHTINSHNHGLASHTHSYTSPHNHRWVDYVSNNNHYSWLANTSKVSINYYGITHGDGISIFISAGNGYAAPGDFWSEDTAMATSGAASGNTGNSGSTMGTPSSSSGNGATANTWRPAGRNFTRQQRV